MKKKIYSLIIALIIMIIPLTFVKAEDSYFKAGENINDSNEINHSYFVGGTNVVSKNNVNGLSFIAGNTVEFGGRTDYGFVAGENVTINGTVENDLFTAGNVIKIEKDADILRDVFAAGRTITVQSDINGNVFLAGTIITLDNITINGDVNIACNTLQIENNVKINGVLKINDDVIINNESKLNVARKEKYATNAITIDFKNSMLNMIIGLLSMIFTGIILALIFPKLFRKVEYDIDIKDFGKKLLYGLLTLIIIPMITIVSIAVVVGMSVGFILIMLYIISLMLATIFAATVIGHNIYTKLFKQKENIYISITIGAVLIKIIEIIPYIGGLVTVFIFLYGLGIICNLFLERNK